MFSAHLRVFAWAVPSTCNALICIIPIAFCSLKSPFSSQPKLHSNRSVLVAPSKYGLPPSLCHSDSPAWFVSSQPLFPLDIVYFFLVLSPIGINPVHSSRSSLLWHFQRMWTLKGRNWIRMVPSGRWVRVARRYFPCPGTVLYLLWL